MNQGARSEAPEGSAQENTSTLFPTKAIGAALLLTMAVFLFTGLTVYRAFRNYGAKLTSAFELQASVNKLNVAPTLTALARATVNTRNLDTEAEYETLEEQVNESLTKVKDLAPTEEIRLAAQTLARVNDKLVAMERQAFELVREGKPGLAQELLRSKRYLRSLEDFHNMYQALESSTRGRVRSELGALTRHAYLVLGANAATVPILIFVWIAAMRIVRRYLDTRREFEEYLRDISLQDELTGLQNRRGFMTLAAQQIKIADRTRKPLALLFADIDDLKVINDTQGHAEGDRALRETASIFFRVVRESDLLARIGGDEFVALLPDSDQAAAEAFVGRLRKAQEDRNEAKHEAPPLYLSVGCVIYNPADPCSLDDLIAQADRFMYERKRARKDPDTRSHQPTA